MPRDYLFPNEDQDLADLKYLAKYGKRPEDHMSLPKEENPAELSENDRIKYKARNGFYPEEHPSPRQVYEVSRRDYPDGLIGSAKAAYQELREYYATANLGFVQSLDPIISIPDTITNKVIDGINLLSRQVAGKDIMSDYWKAHTFSNFADKLVDDADWFYEAASGEAIEETLTTKADSAKDMTKKILYQSGYVVPDVIAASISGIGATALLSKTGLGLSTKLSKLPAMVQHMIGVSAYGQVTGGFEKARDFTALDILNMPLRRYGKIAQMAGGAILFPTYADLMHDPKDSIDVGTYDPDERAVAAIMGAIFPLLGPSGQRSISGDFKSAYVGAKHWVGKQQSLGKIVEQPAYIKEFFDVANRGVENSGMYEPNEVNLYKDLKLQAERRLGREIGDSKIEVTKAIEDVIKTGPNANSLKPHEPTAYAKAIVEAAEAAHQRHTEIQIGLRSMEEMQKDPKALEEATRRLEIKENKLREQEALDAAKDKPGIGRFWKKALTTAYERTVGPEIRFEQAAKSLPGDIPQNAMDRYTMLYAGTNRGRLFLKAAEDNIQFLKMARPNQERFSRYTSAIRDLDIFKRHGKDMVVNDHFTPEDNYASIKKIKKEVIELEGEAGWLDFKDKVDNYFVAGRESLERRLDAGLITKRDYQNMKDIPYATSVELETLRNQITRKELGLTGRDIRETKEIPFYKTSEGKIKSEDVMYLLERTISFTEQEIAQNTFKKSIRAIAHRFPDNTFSQKAIYKYEEKISLGGKLSWKEIPKDRFTKLNKQKEAAKARKQMDKEAAEEFGEGIEIAETKPDYTKQTEALLTTENKKLYVSLNKMQKKINNNVNKLHGVGVQGTDVNRPRRINTTSLRSKADRAFVNYDRNVELSIEKLKSDNARLRKEINLDKDALFELQRELNGPIIRKSDSPLVPDGWTAMEVKVLGKKEHVVVKREMKEIFESPGGESQDVKTNLAHRLLQITSGTPLVKALSVGYQPLFGIYTAPRDIDFFGLTDRNIKSLTKYRVRSYAKAPSYIKEAFNQGEKFNKYAKAGGFTGESASIAALATGALGGRDIKGSLNKWRSKNPKAVEGYRQALRGVNKLSMASEVGIRMSHADYLHETVGMSYKNSVAHTNRLLNFGRKGFMMRYVDDMYAFAGATAQALDGFARSPMVDPKTFSLKMAEYTVTKGALATLAYWLAGPDDMSKLPMDVKLNNYIIPMPMKMRDADGHLHRAYFKWPDERNPFTTAANILIYRGLDQYHGYDFDSEYGRVWLSNIQPVEATKFTPNVQAILAASFNIDPMDYRQIFREADSVIPKDRGRYDRDTNKLALTLSDAINVGSDKGIVSPVGLERAAHSIGLANNLGTGFIGTMFSGGESFEANENAARAWYEHPLVNPWAKKWVYWSRVDTNLTREFENAQEVFSAEDYMIHERTDAMVESAREGEISFQDIPDIINGWDEKEFPGNKANALAVAKRKFKGFGTYKTIMDMLDDDEKQKIPPTASFSFHSMQSTSVKAAWLERKSNELEANLFQSFLEIADAYGITSNQVGQRLNYKNVDIFK